MQAKIFKTTFCCRILANFVEICIYKMINQNKYRFQFKQFGINDNNCAMKIGTDGVLLGAWADISNSKNVLDIGAGSGLISLMIAQRCNANVLGIEIDTLAATEATENVNQSPWNNRIQIINEDFVKWAANNDRISKFDHIISNPPFFKSGPSAPIMTRAIARHDCSLGYEQLLKLSSPLLNDDGRISIISPYDRKDDIIFYCDIINLHISRMTIVYSKTNGNPVRILWEICKKKRPLTQSNISIRDNNNEYSVEYINLTKDFYLKF